MRVAKFFLPLALIGCSIETKINKPPIVHKHVSYELSDLCDTPLTRKKLTLNVFIQPSEKLWDYHLYRAELFSYISKFFSQNNIDCEINYSSQQFKEFLEPSEKGLEILVSDEELLKRSFELSPVIEKEKEQQEIKKRSNSKGYAITKKGIAILNGTWEEFRDYMSIKEQKEFFKGSYKKLSIKEFILRQNANNICHEVLHCTGLWHPESLYPILINRFEGKIPNVMSYQNPVLKDNLPIGANLSLLQQRILHSSIAGNNAYKAFEDSGFDLARFMGKIEFYNKRIRR